MIDECHLTVTAVEYRPAMAELAYLRVLRTQFVYLTATLPPSTEEEFQERNCLSRPVVIRASCNRPNVSYQVRRVDVRRASLLDQSAAAARQLWGDPGLVDQARDKIILYVPFRADAEALSDLLGCAAYTGKTREVDDRQEILHHWIRSPDQPFVVATSALAEGFDYPHIRAVINVNEPESLILFAQESGRAGRDGQLSASIVILPDTWQPDDDFGPSANAMVNCRRDKPLRELKERRAMHRYDRRP